LAHVAGWPHCLSIEARIKPSKIRKGLSYEAELLKQMPNPGDFLHVIDLRRVPLDHPWRPFMLEARLTSVDDVSWRCFRRRDHDARQAFREARLDAAKLRPHAHPSTLYQDALRDLQRVLDTTLSGV
jgi:hypothetical protein